MARNKALQEKKKAFYIITEGSVSEFQYLSSVAEKVKDKFIITIKPAFKSKNTPLDLKERAETETQKSTYDEIWIVFDEDQHFINKPNIKIDLENWEKENKNNIAFSKPHFEHWLFLHLLNSYRNYNKNDFEKEYFKNFQKKYSKKSNEKCATNFQKESLIRNAITKAKSQHLSICHKEETFNLKNNCHYTTLYKLLENLNY